MTEVAWVGPIRVLWPTRRRDEGSLVYMENTMPQHVSQWFRGRAGGDCTVDTAACLLSDGAVCEFRGWCQVQEVVGDGFCATSRFMEPLVGSIIATTNQLGGDKWLERLRKEGLL